MNLPTLEMFGHTLTLLRSHRENFAWQKERHFPIGGAADSYPCFAYVQLDSFQDDHAIYIYPEDVQTLLQVLTDSRLP